MFDILLIVDILQNGTSSENHHLHKERYVAEAVSAFPSCHLLTITWHSRWSSGMPAGLLVERLGFKSLTGQNLVFTVALSHFLIHFLFYN